MSSYQGRQKVSDFAGAKSIDGIDNFLEAKPHMAVGIPLNSSNGVWGEAPGALLFLAITEPLMV